MILAAHKIVRYFLKALECLKETKEFIYEDIKFFQKNRLAIYRVGFM